MTSGPSPPPDRAYRPLPSVDIALLPDELRAARARHLVIAAGVLLLVVAAVAAAFGSRLLALATRGERGDAAFTGATAARDEQSDPLAPLDMRPSTAPEPATPPEVSPPSPSAAPALGASANDADVAPVPSAPEPSTPGRVRAEHPFGKARSWRAALRAAGASAAEANEVIVALEKLVDFRRGQPEDLLVLERDEAKTLTLLEYRAGPVEVYRATRGRGGKLTGSRVAVPIDRRQIAKGSYVAGSLGQALASLGLGTALAGAVIEAFDAKISFRKDTRAGDSVRLIVDEEWVAGSFLRYGAVQAVEYAGERAGKHQAFWFAPEKGEGEFYDASGRAMHGGWLRTPLRYDHVSSPFNPRRRHPILKRIIPHEGIDYSAGTGTPVWAAATGTVSFSGARGANGNLVAIKHGNGYETFYAHLWRIASGMKAGVRVKQRQVVGYVGTTGRSTGPHLHFALKRGGRFIDPATQLNGPGLPLPAALLPRFRARKEHLRAQLERIPLAAAPAAAPEPATETEDLHGEELLDL